MKIKITYEQDNELDEALNTPPNDYIKEGAKIRKSDRYAPFKHAYIDVKNTEKRSEDAEST